MFGLGDILLGKKKLITHSHLKSLHNSYDCQGLVEALDDASLSLTPATLQFLTDLANIGWSDKIISSGLKQRIGKILASNDKHSQSELVFLLSTLVAQSKGREILDGELCVNLLDMFEGSDNTTKTHISYILIEMISLGYSHLIIENGRVDILLRYLNSEDPNLLVQILTVLQALGKAGNKDILNKYDIMERLGKLRMAENQNVLKSADSLYYTLTGWIDGPDGGRSIYGTQSTDYMSYSDLQTNNKKEIVLKDQREEERYVRPTRAAPRIRKDRIGKLRTDGSKFQSDDANDTIVVLGPPETDKTALADISPNESEEEFVVKSKKKKDVRIGESDEEDFELVA